MMLMQHTELNNLSSFLIRHQQLFQNKNILICGQLQAVSLAPLFPNTNATFLIADYSVYNQLLTTQPSLKEQIHFGFTIDDEQNSFDAILLFMPKAKQEAGLWLSTALPTLKINGDIFLIGENKGGVSAAPKLLQPYSSNVQKLDSARHCSLFYAKLSSSVAQPRIDDLYTDYSFHLEPTQPILQISALPGVFSAKELDEGTQLLLASLPELGGDILDIGCGAGVIGATLCHRYPTAKVVMTDINALALSSAKKTLMINGLTAQVSASDMFSDISSEFDFIISNPPFHAGLNTHYAATEKMLRQAPSHLKRHGQVFLVANKFLRYEPILAEVFHSVSVVSENSRFKIIRAF
jgi:16S rRNA (guanine1207-N2)-methyltransferase